MKHEWVLMEIPVGIADKSYKCKNCSLEKDILNDGLIGYWHYDLNNGHMVYNDEEQFKNKLSCISIMMGEILK